MGFFGPRLLSVCYRTFFVGYRLVMHILGRYIKGLVVFGAAVCIRLLGPTLTLMFDKLACLGHIAELGLSQTSCYTQLSIL